MFESKFIFVGKIFFIVFLVINLPQFLPINLFQVSYFLVITTTIFDTASVLVLSLSISKFIHVRNLKLVENLNTTDDINSRQIEKINLQKINVKNDNILSLSVAICFAILTLIQPLILIFTVNQSDIYATRILSSINKEYRIQEKGIEEFMSKENSNENNEMPNIEDRISEMSRLKDLKIKNFLKRNNRTKFEGVKTILRNFILGSIWTICFYKIYLI